MTNSLEDLARRARLLALQERANEIAAQPSRPAPTGGSATAPGAVDDLRSRAVSSITQFGAGSQEGIAEMAGFPVDAVTPVVEGLGETGRRYISTGINPETGQPNPIVLNPDFNPSIAAPVGGSESLDGLMRPLREGVPDPQTAGDRIARRMGQETGATAVGLPVALSTRAGRSSPARAAITEFFSGLGSGAGAAAANEAFPDSLTAEIMGQLGGGIAAGRMGARATGLRGTSADVRPGVDEQRAIASDAYGEVRADTRILPSESTQGLADALTDRMARERINPRLQPNASNVLDAILTDLQGANRIEDIENLRRLTESAMPATASPADRRLAQIMRRQITEYLDGLGDDVADRLRDGRDAHRRGSAATSVEGMLDRARLRAASTGSGGNEINAIRQNLRRILDQPRLQRSFTESELAEIREIVEGTTDQNFFRRLSRFAPSSGGLSAMLGIGGTLASPQVALPIMGATEAARFAGERSTGRAVNALLQSLAPNRVTQPGALGIDPTINALLAARIGASAE